MSNKIAINGGTPLLGEVRVSGAKNASLPIIAASLLAKAPVEISNIPVLRDVSTMLELLAELGSKIKLIGGNQVVIDASSLTHLTVDYPLVKTMRASVLVLGPLLSRWREVKIALPGGCAIGQRPINLHLDALVKMGADIEMQDGFVLAKTKSRLVGTEINFPTVTVTGTENILMAATLAKGVTTLVNAAREPEVIDLARFLVKMGAKIKGAGTSQITIEGVSELRAADYAVLPDRIEAGTYLTAAVMTGGAITLNNVNPKPLAAVIAKFKEAGALVKAYDHSIEVDMRSRRLKAVDICTNPYPGFPTDMQAQFIAMNTLAKGCARVEETIFDNRFMHVAELRRLGAHIDIKGNVATVTGVKCLRGAPVSATDLRAGASLLIAGLAAEGETIIDEVCHVDRGYEFVEEKLGLLGANMKRV